MVHFLIVEDDVDSAQLLTYYIENSGVNWNAISHTEYIEEAVKYLGSNAVDVLICDYRLPDGMASDLIARIFPIKPKISILVSGFDALNQTNGFDKKFTKPIDINALISFIKSNLKNKEQ